MAQRVAHVHRRRRVAPARLPPRLRLRRAGLIVVAVIGGFILGLLVLSVGPRIVSRWRETQLLTRAQTELRRDNFAAAAEAAQETLKINGNSLAAFRVLAETTEKQNKAETVMWRSEIARLQPGDVDSQLNLASAALRFGQLDLARRALENVAKENRDSAPYNVVAGWLSHAQGDEAGMERHFAAALDKEPKNETYQFNLAVVRIKSPDPEKSNWARETLQHLAKSAPFRAGSLRALLSDAVQRSDFSAADHVAQELQMSPQVTFSDYLLCLDFYKKLDDKKFAALLDKVKPVAARDRETFAQLLAWMNKNGLTAELLRWTEKLPPEKTNQPASAVEIADALSSQKSWTRLRRWTRNGSWGESEYLRLAYQAFALRQTRQSAADTEFGSLWRAAEAACDDNPERVIRLARLASKWNLPSEAEQLWLRVAHNPFTRREALESLFDIYRSNNDLPNLCLTAMRLHEASPDEPLLAAEYARLSLLLGRNVNEGHRVAKEAFDQAPDEPLCLVTEAFSLRSLNRKSEALDLLKKLPAEKSHEPHAAAYVAAILLDNNQPDVAREFIAAAKSGSIFPEEQKMLDNAIANYEINQRPEPSPVVPAGTPTPAPPPMGTPTPSPTPTPVDLSP